MLSSTQENIKQIIDKLQLLDFTLNTLNLIHKEDATKADELVRRASTHKLKLIDEILRLSNANAVVLATTIKPELA